MANNRRDVCCVFFKQVHRMNSERPEVHRDLPWAYPLETVFETVRNAWNNPTITLNTWQLSVPPLQ